MKFKKLLLLPLAALLLAGCNPTPSASETPSEAPTTSTVEVEPVGINISAAGDATTLEIGQTLALTATVLPAGAAQTVTWASSDEAKATVSEAGVVTGVAAGSIFISATSTKNELVTKQYALTIVTPPDPVIEPEDIMISAVGSATSVAVGATLQLGATVLPSGAPQGVTWTSSDVNKASVSPTGLVSGVAVGDVIITATSTEKATVSETYGIAVTEAEVPGQTEDWENMDYSDHADFVNYPHVPADTPFKVKGVVTHVAPVADGKVNYYIQNGAEGYYIYGQDAVAFPVVKGKAYAVGGFYKNFNGTRELVDVEYFVELDEVLDFTVSNVSDKDFSSLDDLAPYHASFIDIDLAVIVSIPNIGASAYTVRAKVNDFELEVRVDPINMVAEEFNDINYKFNNAPVGSSLSMRGIMSAFGYGTPKNQVLIVSAADLVTATLTPNERATVALSTLEILESVVPTVNSIELPLDHEGYDGLTFAWASNKPAIISNAGTVTHPELTTEVVLTATASLEGATKTRDFKLVVFGTDNTKLTVLHTLDLEDAGPANQYGNSTMKGSYDDKVGNVVESGTPLTSWWLHNTLIGGDGNDKRTGEFAMRTQSNADQARSGRIELVDNTYTFNMIEFDSGIYGANRKGMVIHFEISTDDGATWVELDRTFTINHFTLETYRVQFDAAGPVRIALVMEAGTGQRINVDNLKLIQEAR